MVTWWNLYFVGWVTGGLDFWSDEAHMTPRFSLQVLATLTCAHSFGTSLSYAFPFQLSQRKQTFVKPADIFAGDSDPVLKPLPGTHSNSWHKMYFLCQQRSGFLLTSRPEREENGFVVTARGLKPLQPGSREKRLRLGGFDWTSGRGAWLNAE